MVSYILTLSLITPMALGFAYNNADITVTRKVYVSFAIQELDPESLVSNPNRGQYGPRHALPALAVYSLICDKKYGEAIKIDISSFKYRTFQIIK